MGKIFDMGKNLHLKESEAIKQFPPIEITEDLAKFAKHIMDELISPVFMRMFGSGTQTATSINSRMETIIEGDTRKAEVKLIEYKPTIEEIK